MINAKYRGLRTDGKGFVYGYLFLTTIDTVNTISLKPCIQQIQNNKVRYDTFEVIPETVGQYTGFIAEKCKNNIEKEIYAGDVFRETRETDEGDVYQYNVVVWVRQRGAFAMIPKGCYEDFMQNDLSVDPDFSWLFEEAHLYDFSIDVGLTKVGNIHQK